MNKFKFNILVAAVAASGMLSSCAESWLDTTSMVDDNTETAYRTEQNAYRALIGCYDAYRRTNVSFSFPFVSEVMSDQTFAGMGPSDITPTAIDRFDLSFAPSQHDFLSELWTNYWKVIYRCNFLISQEENIQWGNNRGLYMGQCRAIRAFNYFEMVRIWGNIPLFLEPVNENREQAPIDDVYNAIFEDLKYACENIPANAYPKADAAANDGYLTQAAAKAMLARAYLFYTGRYGKEPAVEGVTKASVLQGLEDVIASGEYKLVDEFKNLWVPASVKVSANEKTFDTAKTTYAGDGNSEVVFSIKFSGLGTWNSIGANNVSEDYGNHWIVMLGSRSLAPVKANLDTPYGTGWGSWQVNPRFYESFEAGDTRRDASIFSYYDKKINLHAEWDNLLNDSKDFTGYAQTKYMPMAYYDASSATINLSDMQISQNQDYVVMRYADVLLMAAELGSSNALKYLNEVAGRAYGDRNHYTACTQENIMNERYKEFAFEGIHYWDLLRQGLNVAAAAVTESMTVSSLGVETTYTVNGQNLIDKEGYLQIPQTQITLSNGVLKQNKGW